MRNLITYCKILTVSVMLLMVSWQAKAQTGMPGDRTLDSLKNLISKTSSSDFDRLAKLNMELADRAVSLYLFDESSEAASKAVLYAKEVNDYTTQLRGYLLLGNNKLLLGESVKAIENYLSARNVLEKRGQDLSAKKNDGTLDKKYVDEMLHQDAITDADIVSQIGRVYLNRRHYTHAIDNFQKALDVYNKLGCDQKALSTRHDLAVCYSLNNDLDNAFKYYDELLKDYKKMDDWQSTKETYQCISDILIKKRDYKKLEKYNSELYNECSHRGNMKEAYNALSNLAYACVCNGKYDQARMYYDNLLEKAPPFFTDTRELELLQASTYTNRGLCNHNAGLYYESIADLKKALALREQNKQYKEAAEVANLLAHIYFIHDDLHNADYYQQQAERNAEDSGNRDVKRLVYKNYNEILQKKGEYEEALKKYQKYLDLGDAEKFENDDKNRQLSEDLRQLNNAERSYLDGLVEEDMQEHQRREEELRRAKLESDLAQALQQRENDSLKTVALEASQRLLMEQARRAEAEREKAEEARLKAELESQQARQNEEMLKLKSSQDEALRRATEAENDVLKQKQKEEKYIYFGIIAGVIILFFLGFSIAMRNKNKKLKEQQAEIELKNADLLMKNEEITLQKENLLAANNEILTKNEELSRQKEVIELANKSITDSIVYAKRIQTAVCPSADFLDSYNFQHFLFFRPRDIVSGDYYWFYSDNSNHVFIVAADCTGHGVPGAFMSMLGLSLFNKIVAERNIIEPDLILNDLRKEVKLALHQDSIASSQKDGMDLSLVRLDVDTNMLHFAAANNNGYLVQHFGKDQEEQAKANLLKPEHLRETEDGYMRLTIMPADSMPIGVYIREKESFTKTSYQLKKGDCFYLTSDGYIDQFGGRWGRKFLTKNFQKLVMDINEFDMKRQEQIVVETHDNWIGDSYDQLDDIIVIGVRV